ncbi:MAG: hypothetical protein GYB33_05980 [Gammaproteobacteria bacterium]|uniref:hypothetical protein n=1 Tax=Pseudomaricurvus alcaniphilus TaxID=1166482 RepID=UPI00140D5619|nr:hypothetical protein [Pseudomaricurvus alcaniphilus]MBR9909887.1 hypothetical protein [Gammaproteobacteria bacterium]NHN38613.1 hypothetical protein [Pseudomaricurvus alcaniphilus]
MSDDIEDDVVEYRSYSVEDHTVASRQRIRNQLNAEIAEFLARGGKIQVLDPNVVAEPPQVPANDYNRLPL